MAAAHCAALRPRLEDAVEPARCAAGWRRPAASLVFHRRQHRQLGCVVRGDASVASRSRGDDTAQLPPPLAGRTRSLRVQHPRHLADAGGDRHAGRRSSCWGFRRHWSAARNCAAARRRACLCRRCTVAAGYLLRTDKDAPALGKGPAAGVGSNRGRGGSRGSRSNGIRAGPLGLPADRRQGSVKSFAFEICNGERVGASLPTQLRQRQRLLARVSHVLRWPPAERACFSSWSTASIKRLALMRDWPNGTLTWICPPAAERRCDGSSASRRGTSTHAPPCLRRSSDSASRLCSDASNKVPFAEYSFRVAAYSFKVAVISFFDTQAACRKTITRRCNVSSNSRSRSRVGSILLARTWP